MEESEVCSRNLANKSVCENFFSFCWTFNCIQLWLTIGHNQNVPNMSGKFGRFREDCYQ